MYHIDRITNNSYYQATKTKQNVHHRGSSDVATQISARNVWPKLAKGGGIGSTCEAKDTTKEMERGTILCTNFILLNQQVVRRPRVCCCSVYNSPLIMRNEAEFSKSSFDDFIIIGNRCTFSFEKILNIVIHVKNYST